MKSPVEIRGVVFLRYLMVRFTRWRTMHMCSCKLVAISLTVGAGLYAGSLTFNGSNFSVVQLDTKTGIDTAIGEFMVNNTVGAGFINVLNASNNWLVQHLPVGR